MQEHSPQLPLPTFTSKGFHKAGECVIDDAHQGNELVVEHSDVIYRPDAPTEKRMPMVFPMARDFPSILVSS